MFKFFQISLFILKESEYESSSLFNLFLVFVEFMKQFEVALPLISGHWESTRAQRGSQVLHTLFCFLFPVTNASVCHMKILRTLVSKLKRGTCVFTLGFGYF